MRAVKLSTAFRYTGKQIARAVDRIDNRKKGQVWEVSKDKRKIRADNYDKGVNDDGRSDKGRRMNKDNDWSSIASVEGSKEAQIEAERRAQEEEEAREEAAKLKELKKIKAGALRGPGKKVANPNFKTGGGKVVPGYKPAKNRRKVVNGQIQPR